jgi:hypothetical protein
VNETKLVLCHIVTCLNSEGQSRAVDNKLGLKVQTLHIDNMIDTYIHLYLIWHRYKYIIYMDMHA